jgi:ketosteroid isomerase-like protein
MDDQSAATAREPEELERLFVERMNDGDVEGLVALFEPDAVMRHSPGEVAVGHRAIRQVFERLVADRTRLTLGEQRPMLRSGELAMGSTRLADGGVTCEVARRQADGTWRWVIDNWNVLDG